MTSEAEDLPARPMPQPLPPLIPRLLMGAENPPVMGGRRISCSGSSLPILFRSPAQQVVDRDGRHDSLRQFVVPVHAHLELDLLVESLSCFSERSGYQMSEDHVVCRSVSVVDESGRPAIVLSCEKGVASMRLGVGQGPVVSSCSDDATASLDLAPARGSWPRLTLTLDADGVPFVLLRSDAGKPLVSIAGGDRPGIAVYGNGRVLLEVGLDHDGAQIVLREDSGSAVRVLKVRT